MARDERLAACRASRVLELADLARVQRKDGSFEEVGYGGLNYSMVSTHSAILFLVRATTPITESSSR